MPRKGPSRYDLLSDEQRVTFTADDDNVVLRSKISSFIGNPSNTAAFTNAHASLKKSLSGFACEDEVLQGYVLICNEQDRLNSTRTYQTLVTQIKGGLLAFLTYTNQKDLKLTDFDTPDIKAYLKWLKDSAKTNKNEPYSENTLRKYYGTTKAIFEKLKESEHLRNSLSERLTFPQNPFCGAHEATTPTEIFNDYEWERLIRACAKEVLTTIYTVQSYWEVLDSTCVMPDTSQRGRSQYADVRSVLWKLNQYYPFPKILPTYTKLLKKNPALANAIQKFHGGYNNIMQAFSPTVKTIFPFAVLMGIYTCANTSPLRDIRLDDIEPIDVFDKRRVKLTLIKGRSDNYSRTFATLVSPLYCRTVGIS